MSKWKVYISSTFIDLNEFRTHLINLFQNELQDSFTLNKIMERMYDDGSHTPFVEDCIREVENSDVYLIILGNRTGAFPPGENKRTYTEIELDTAIEKKKKIFCFHLREFDTNKIDNRSKHREILEDFAGFPIHTFIDTKDLENSLFKCLWQYASKAPVYTANPYKGLMAFDYNDGDYFFGRSAEIEECIKKIVTSRGNLTLSVIGDSGIGKTSFVQAGLLHRLKNEKLLGYGDFRQVIVTPGSHPFSNLTYQLLLSGIAVGHDAAAVTDLSNTIIFLNQFEEIITQCNTPESLHERDQFFEFLESNQHQNKNGKCIIITTFRIEYTSKLANFNFIKNSQTYLLPGLDYNISLDKWKQSITEIITKPALRNGVRIKADLKEMLINELMEVKGTLSVLQFALSKLWSETEVSEGIITSDNYNAMTESRGLPGIIEEHAEAVIARIVGNSAEATVREKIIKSIFVNLVEVTESLLDVKKTVRKDELFQNLKTYSPKLVNDIFDDLVSEKSRLLIESQVGKELINVDLVHEVLIRKWGRLRSWVNERREALEFQKIILADVKIYQVEKTGLYKGSKLRQATRWQQGNADLAGGEIDKFIADSADRQKSIIRKAAIIIPTVIVLLILALTQPTGITYTQAAVASQHAVKSYQPDSVISSQFFVTVNNKRYWVRIDYDTIDYVYNKITLLDENDSVRKIIPFPGGKNVDFSKGNISWLDTSYTYLNIGRIENDSVTIVKKIKIPGTSSLRTEWTGISRFDSSQRNRTRNIYTIDFAKRHLILLFRKEIYFFSDYLEDKAYTNSRRDSTYGAEVIRIHDSYAIVAEKFRSTLYHIRADGTIFQTDSTIIRLFEKGFLHYSKDYKYLFYINGDNERIEIFKSFVPEKLSDLDSPFYSVARPPGILKLPSVEGLAVDFNQSLHLFEQAGEAYLVITCSDGQSLTSEGKAYLADLKKGIQIEIGSGRDLLLHDWELFSSGDYLTVVSPTKYSSGSSFFYRVKKTGLLKIDNFSQRVNAVEEFDSAHLSIVFTDANQDLRIAQVPKEKMIGPAIGHSIFNLENRRVGAFYWSAGHKFMFYSTGPALYFGSSRKLMHRLTALAGDNNEISNVFSHGNSLFVHAQDNDHVIERHFTLLGLKLWPVDWPAITSQN